MTLHIHQFQKREHTVKTNRNISAFDGSKKIKQSSKKNVLKLWNASIRLRRSIHFSDTRLWPSFAATASVSSASRFQFIIQIQFLVSSLALSAIRRLISNSNSTQFKQIWPAEIPISLASKTLSAVWRGTRHKISFGSEKRFSISPTSLFISPFYRLSGNIKADWAVYFFRGSARSLGKHQPSLIVRNSQVLALLEVAANVISITMPCCS